MYFDIYEDSHMKKEGTKTLHQGSLKALHLDGAFHMQTSYKDTNQNTIKVLTKTLSMCQNTIKLIT